MTVLLRQAEGGKSMVTTRSWVRARREQLANDPDVVALRREHQRRAVLAVSRVRAGAGAKECLDDVALAGVGGVHQCRVAIVVLVLELDPFVDEARERRQVPR